MATSSFRLPPPLSSSTSTTPNDSTSSSSRTRSLENVNADEKPTSSIDIQSTKHVHLDETNLSSSTHLDETNLSSSTESTNGLPFANENIGTIKQRSPHNQNSNLYNNNNSSMNSIKRSLPIQFFEQTIKPSYPLTTAIYDNNERFIQNNHIRKPATLAQPINGNGLAYKQTKVVK